MLESKSRSIMLFQIVVTLLFIGQVVASEKSTCYECFGFNDPTAPEQDGNLNFSRHCAVVDEQTKISRPCTKELGCRYDIFSYKATTGKVYDVTMRKCNRFGDEIEEICKNKSGEHPFEKYSVYGCICQGELCNTFTFTTTLMPITTEPEPTTDPESTTDPDFTTEDPGNSTANSTALALLPTDWSISLTTLISNYIWLYLW
ncbi:unnamed protein product [Bursaphelenchus okinawaensis]|uniref:Protein quiver n=1 Tax=Bursaphelenchus okinawaensis TaxID=465554 RepID=A0A811L5Q2_9BILA|nr:unnamed protein product [Bursaphelenchus okinawaensis]CAG9117139.1 unnamed protein product [Bursaphelenchus okinawaensis]